MSANSTPRAAVPAQGSPPNTMQIQRYQLPLQNRQVFGLLSLATPLDAAATATVPGAAAAQAQSTPPPAKRRRTTTTVQNIFVLRPWNDMLYELLKFRGEKGNCMVPHKAGGDLGKWVASQRSQYLHQLQKGHDNQNSDGAQKHGNAALDPNRLTDERIQVLNSVGFIWDVIQADNDERWKKRFSDLVAYKRQHGHCNAPQSTDLGKWVKMQRENKHEAELKAAGACPERKKPRPCLSEDRKKKLESIGFQWRVAKPPVGWDNRFEQLSQYSRLNGDCNVPQSYPPDKPFGRWVMKQRCEYSQKVRGLKSQLTTDRENRLNTIGFEWVAPGFHKKSNHLPGDEREDGDDEEEGEEQGHKETTNWL